MARPVNARATMIGAEECRLSWETAMAAPDATPPSLELRYVVQYRSPSGLMGVIGLVNWDETLVPAKYGATAHMRGLRRRRGTSFASSRSTQHQALAAVLGHLAAAARHLTP